MHDLLSTLFSSQSNLSTIFLTFCFIISILILAQIEASFVEVQAQEYCLGRYVLVGPKCILREYLFPWNLQTQTTGFLETPSSCLKSNHEMEHFLEIRNLLRASILECISYAECAILFQTVTWCSHILFVSPSMLNSCYIQTHIRIHLRTTWIMGSRGLLELTMV